MYQSLYWNIHLHDINQLWAQLGDQRPWLGLLPLSQLASGSGPWILCLEQKGYKRADKGLVLTWGQTHFQPRNAREIEKSHDLMGTLNYGHLPVDCNDSNFIFLFHYGVWVSDFPKITLKKPMAVTIVCESEWRHVVLWRTSILIQFALQE